jgi:Tfp pilus assembly pilus retraction ATPase PilT
MPMKTVVLEEVVFPKVSKLYEVEPRITESLALKNFQQNRLEYDALKGSEYLNIHFDRSYYKELLEYHAIYEFNNLKAKTFVSLNQFLDAYRLTNVSHDPQYTPVTHLCQRLKRSSSGPISVILVSGIPGSGKGRFSASLARTLKQEKLRTMAFKMPTIQASVSYKTDVFVAALDQAVSEDPEIDVVIATLPSYHHLKKAIFELRKHEGFTAKFDIKCVLTKVAANNFFINENRNLYQFLIENCMKGVS